MRFYAEIDLQGRIKPLYNSDYDVFKKLKKNTPLEFEVKQKRNYQFHKKGMALFNLGFENQDQIKSFDNYRKIMTMKAGYYDTEVTDKGVVYFAKSISFANMDENDFNDLYKALTHVIAKELGLEDETVRNEINNFL